MHHKRPFHRRKFKRRRKLAFRGYPKNLVTFNNLATIDVTTSDVIDTTTTTNALFLPTRSNNSFQDRHGDRTTIRSIRFVWTIKPGTLQISGSWCRIVLFWDVQPNNAFPSGPLPFAALTPTSLPDPQYTQRFRILYDKRVFIATTQLFDGSATPIQDKFFRKNLELVSVFTGNAGSITDVQSGSLLLLVIGDLANGANQNPVITFSTRCKFDP